MRRPKAHDMKEKTMSSKLHLRTSHITDYLDGTRMKASEMAVMRALALYHNDEKGYAWPSMARICKISGHSLNTVRKSLKTLEDHGLLVRTIRPPETTIYRLNGDAIDSLYTRALAEQAATCSHTPQELTPDQPAPVEAPVAPQVHAHAPVEVEIVSTPVQAVEAPQEPANAPEGTITQKTPEIPAETPSEPVQGELLPAPAPKKTRKPRKSSRAAETPGLEEDFIEFYTTYPLKKDRGTARGTYEKVRRRGVPAEEILEGARRYAEAMSAKLALDPGQKRYIKHPSSWLNAESWLNAYEDEAPVQELTPTQRKVRRLAQSLQAMQDAQGLPQGPGMYQAPALTSTQQAPVQATRELTYSPAGQAAPMGTQDAAPADSMWSSARWTRTKYGAPQLV